MLAFAKINIGLTVFGKQASGYHDIEGIFQNVDIADRITLSLVEEPGVVIHGDLGCPAEQSSVHQAIVAFQRVWGDCPANTGIEARVAKKIPSGAGLGGAGADAAAAILGLDRLFDAKLPRAELANIAASVASDVPFFIYGGAAVVRGRGELVEPIEPRVDFGLIVVKPSWDSKTPQAYAELDALRNAGELRAPHSARKLGEERCLAQPTAVLVDEYSLPAASWTFQNDFEHALRRAHPEYASLFEIMMECGADFVSMTGSGSCFYGIFPSKERAVEAAKKFKELLRGKAKRGLLPTTRIFATQPLARSIKVSYIQGCSEDTRSDKERPCYGSD